MIEKKRILKAALLSMILAPCLSIKLFKVLDLSLSYEKLDPNDDVMVFFRNLYLSFSNNRLHVLLTAISVFFLYYIYDIIKKEIKEKEKWLTIFFSVLFSICQLIALCYKKYGTIRAVLYPDFLIIRFRAFLKYGAVALTAYLFVSVLLFVVSKYLIDNENEESFKPGKKLFIISALLFLISYIPYFIIFYPGTSNEDTTIQIMQYFGIKSYINDMTPLRGDDIFFSNHHPYLLTLIFGSFAKLGLYLSDIRIGIALYVFLHMIFTSLVFSSGIYYLSYCGVSKKRIIFLQGLFMLLPIFPLYAVCMVKDTVYSGFFFFLTLFLSEIVRTRGRALLRSKFTILFSLNALLLMLSKVYGMHVFLITSLAVVIYILAVERREPATQNGVDDGKFEEEPDTPVADMSIFSASRLALSGDAFRESAGSPRRTRTGDSAEMENPSLKQLRGEPSLNFSPLSARANAENMLMSSPEGRKATLVALASTLIPIIIFRLYLTLILPALKVAPGGIQEALSVPFQQTARYVTEYENEVTEEERKAINKILPYKKLKVLYNPELSDPVKKRYNQDAKNRDLKRYIVTWARMGIKHPLTYIEAFLNNTYQYYDMSKKSSLEYYEMNTYLLDHPEKYDPDEYSYLYIENREDTRSERYAVNQIVLLIQKIPLLNFFASLGLLPWITGIVIIYLIKNKRGRDLVTLLPCILTLLLCLLSPDNGNSRYVMPLFYTLPYLTALFLKPVDNKKV